VADDTLGPEECLVSKVDGLSSTAVLGQSGLLVFCQSRVGNGNLYRVLAEFVIISFVIASREACDANAMVK
jgi:hypothetical protein